MDRELNKCAFLLNFFLCSTYNELVNFGNKYQNGTMDWCTLSEVITQNAYVRLYLGYYQI